MKVRQAMRRDVVTCRMDNNLAVVAARMWECNCGAMPVLDDRGRVVGMITDRDVCIAVGTRHRCAADISVVEVMSAQVATCQPDDDIVDAIRTMRERRIRRLPVVDADGVLQGLLTLDDLALVAADASAVAIPFEEVVGLIRSVSGRGGRQFVH